MIPLRALLLALPLLPTGPWSQDSTRTRGAGAMAGFPPARQVARAADANRDGEVTAEEWSALRLWLDPAGTGRVDTDALMVAVALPMIERSEDGVLTLDDLLQTFAELDANRDDELDAGELAPRTAAGGNRAAAVSGRQRQGPSRLSMAVLMVRPADADDDGRVDFDEWGAFVDGLAFAEDDAIAPEVVAAWIAHEEGEPGDPQGFDAPGILGWVRGGVDPDGDGWTALEDLQGLFERLDDDADGTLTAEELSFARSFRFGGVSARDRARPPLMPWQRNLEDALALVESSGRPLLVCVNMDDEFASESFAWSRYRDPAFAELVRGFVPVLASPNRHDPRDHDDRGRRIVDERFGRLTSSEHIDIESALYERYFDGTRSAPRHLGVAPDGRVLFDIYLENDLSKVDEALRVHGVPPTEAPPAPATLSEPALLASPDAAHREELEARFLAGDAALRARLAVLALSDVRPTQHPEILRLALHDPSAAVRRQGAWTLARAPEQAPVELYARALAGARGDERLSAALRAALLTVPAPDATAALRLARAEEGLRRPSRWLDVAGWRAALSWAGAPRDPERGGVGGAETSGDDDRLDALLARLEGALAEDLHDPELNLAFAAAAMRKAQQAIREGGDPRFFLADVLAAAGRAAAALPAAASDGRPDAYLAWGHHLLGDGEAAARHLERALPALLPWAGTPLAGRALELLLDLRIRALYAGIEAGEEADETWSTWVADLHAAQRVLRAHPMGSERAVTTYVECLNVLGVAGVQGAALGSWLERFPTSGTLHEALRTQLLRDGGARELRAAYDALLAERPAAPAQGWYAGLASLLAAERHVQNRADDAAREAYRESARRFEAAAAAKEEYDESASHYACLANAGLARLELEAESWSEALDALRRGIDASPESVWKRDGLGNSPRETAQLLYESLGRASRTDEAEELRHFLAERGLELEG